MGVMTESNDVLSTSSGTSVGLTAPIRGYRFTVTIDGLGVASFKEVQGFSAEVDTTEYREGGFSILTKRKLPGLVNYGDLTLTKGFYQSALLYEFFNSYLEGANTKPVEEATITVYDNKGDAQAAWLVSNCWPKQYSSTDLNAEDSSILIETLVLAHEGIVRTAITT